MAAPTPLTNLELEKILKLLAEGLPTAKIAQRFNKSTTTIYQIRDGVHSLQQKAAVRAKQLVQVEACPGCGRPLITPCPVCRMRENLESRGGFDRSAWTPPGSR